MNSSTGFPNTKFYTLIAYFPFKSFPVKNPLTNVASNIDPGIFEEP